MNSGTQELVEEMGMYFKGLGLPRAAGRIFGFLMVCEPPEQAAGEIREAIDLSLASISSNARLLQHLGFVEQRSRQGERKTYYRLRDDRWMELTRQKQGTVDDLARVARRVEQHGGLPRTDALEEMIAFAEFMQQELPRMAARWDAVRESRSMER